jgi:hypothetical protein
MNDSADSIRRILAERDRQKEELEWVNADPQSLAKRADTLRNLYQTLINGDERKITVGSLVVWKDGLRNRQRPRYCEPAVVIEIHEPDGGVLFDQEPNSGSQYFREPLTIQVGLLDDAGDLVMYFCDKRRFRPLEDKRE